MMPTSAAGLSPQPARLALRALGGTCVGHGQAPSGFATLEEAIEAILLARGGSRCEVVWR